MLASKKSKFLAGFLALILGILQFQGLSIASAEGGYIVFQDGPFDRDNFDNLPTDYDITQISFGVEKDFPDMYEFFIGFINPIVPNQFDGTNGSFASLMIDVNNDGKEDYSLDTSNESYVKNDVHNGLLTDRRNGKADNLSKCDVETWTNIESQATWIAFAIPMNCLPFRSTFGIMGYAGSDVGKNNYDYSGSEYWIINPSQSDSPDLNVDNSSTTDLPLAPSNHASVISNPADAPDDLSSLSRGLSNSVVTVWCGDGLGSGWSADVELTQSMKDSGIKSYIITNHHVIDACTDGQEIDIDLSNGDRVRGRVITWDVDNDLAGIVTTTSIPGLDWVGPAPAQGWWVGVLGSPVGQPGILTTGIASSEPSDYVGFMSAPINRGNSGGPVFDNIGRVIGVSTAIRLDSQGRDTQGFNVYQGTPLLCGAVVECASSDIWAGSSGSLFPSGTALYIPLILLVTGAVVLAIVLTRRKSTPNFATPFQNQNFKPTPGAPQIPGAIIRPGSMPPPPPPGSMPPPPPGRR
jgi:S1-C subfamily serine protease